MKDICPEDTLRIILPAASIPDHSTVTKVRGEQRFTLKHDLKVYLDKGKEGPLVISGFFLVSSRGEINQIPGDRELVMLITAERFIDELRMSWEPDQ